MLAIVLSYLWQLLMIFICILYSNNAFPLRFVDGVVTHPFRDRLSAIVIAGDRSTECSRAKCLAHGNESISVDFAIYS